MVSIAPTTNGDETGPVAGQFTVSQMGDPTATETELTYVVSGTADSGDDFVALTGTVTLPAGDDTSATIDVTIIDDAIVEEAESIIISLTEKTSGDADIDIDTNNDTAMINIADNDSATVGVDFGTNGDEDGPIAGEISITQSAESSTDTVISYLVGGTATSGDDFVALSGTVTIDAGTTSSTIPIPVIDDALVEGLEDVQITLDMITAGDNEITIDGGNDSGTIFIVDNDSATVGIAGTKNGRESGPVDGQFTVTQSGESSSDTVIEYTVSGDATSGADFTPLSGTVTILAGDTSAVIDVTILEDIDVEGTETIIVTLDSLTSDGDVTIDPDAEASAIQIIDNDLKNVVKASVDAAGNLVIQGDDLDNRITIQTNGGNSYLITGINGTTILDQAGSAKQSHTVTGVVGDVTVRMDPIGDGPASNDSFTFLPQEGGQLSLVPNDLTIANAGTGDENFIGNVAIGGDLNIERVGTAGTKNTIHATAITGNLNVDNPQLSTTTITNSATQNTTVGGFVRIVNGSGATTSIGDNVGRTTITGDVIILNDSTNSNTITNTSIGGGGGQLFAGGLFVAKKDNVGAGTQSLTIQDNTNVFGPTIVANFSVQTGAIPKPAAAAPIPPAETIGGTTMLTVINSQLQGNGIPIGMLPSNLPSSLAQTATPSVEIGTTNTVTPGLPVYIPLTGSDPALLVRNGAGMDTTMIQGAMTTIGSGISQPIGATSLLSAVEIHNGDGGGMVSFGPTASDPASSRLTVQGSLIIENGSNADGVIDSTIINSTTVTGRVYVYNAGGAGATNTMINNSSLGTNETGGPLGNPLAVFNDVGPDTFSLSSSVVPWGAFINHDSSSGGLGTSSSSTTITGGQIGTRASGPAGVGTGALSADLGAEFPTPFTAAPLGAPPVDGVPLPFLHPFVPGDGLGIGGSSGGDTVTITEASGATTPLAIGGFVDVVTSTATPGSPDLPDSVTVSGNATLPTPLVSLSIITGNAGDTVLLENIVIAGGPQLPANPFPAPGRPATVSLGVFTNGGLDTLTIGDNVTIAPLAESSVIILSGGTPFDNDELIDPNDVLTSLLGGGIVVFP